MADLRKLTLLHSNDMHGDFLSEQVDDRLVGGVSLLSGYIQKTRAEEENVLYAVAGDMFRGSVIDSEFKGISTIEIMNLLGPDVATLGNHEVDYGVSHILFIEKMARFPIINANLYIKTNHVRLFNSHVILKSGGMKVLFIGLLTEEVLAQARKDGLVGAIVDVAEAAAEVGRICDSYKTEDIDLTVLLTHIGFEEDRRLAELLDPRWGVDIIIGGHSHTELKEPAVVNGIPIAQAASGTDQIGRFDLIVDADTNSIHSYTWQLVPIDDEHCPRDAELEEVIGSYKQRTDRKYGRLVTRFQRRLTHPRRDRETELGRLFADLFRESLGVDVMMLASGSIRTEQMGPIVTYSDLAECFPYADEVWRISVTGAQLRHMIEYVFRPEVFDGVHTEFYQFSRGIRFEVDVSSRRLLSLSFENKPLENDRIYTVGLQNFHYRNMQSFFDITEEELAKNRASRVAATCGQDVLDERLSQMELVKCPDDQRWITIEE